MHKLKRSRYNSFFLCLSTLRSARVQRSGFASHRRTSVVCFAFSLFSSSCFTSNDRRGGIASKGAFPSARYVRPKPAPTLHEHTLTARAAGVTWEDCRRLRAPILSTAFSPKLTVRRKLSARWTNETSVHRHVLTLSQRYRRGPESGTSR